MCVFVCVGGQKTQNLHVAFAQCDTTRAITPDSWIPPALASRTAGMSEAKSSISARRETQDEVLHVDGPCNYLFWGRWEESIRDQDFFVLVAQDSWHLSS